VLPTYLYLQVHDVFSSLHIRQADVQASVNAARAQQCGVQYVRSVRRGHDDDAAECGDAVEFCEELR
jgi:hypothetical protein